MRKNKENKRDDRLSVSSRLYYVWVVFCIDSHNSRLSWPYLRVINLLVYKVILFNKSIESIIQTNKIIV